MQFRKVANTDKIQCLVAQYDGETKRTRQKLLCTLDLSTPGLSGEYMSNKFAFGSAEEKAAFVAEIDSFLIQHRNDNAAEIAKTMFIDMGMRSYDFIELLKNAPNALSEKDGEFLADTLESLISQLRASH